MVTHDMLRCMQRALQGHHRAAQLNESCIVVMHSALLNHRCALQWADFS